MNNNLYKLPNQEIEKSIIYEIPRQQSSNFSRFEPSGANRITYKVKEDIQQPRNRTD